jgi:hypothetical protein
VDIILLLGRIISRDRDIVHHLGGIVRHQGQSARLATGRCLGEGVSLVRVQIFISGTGFSLSTRLAFFIFCDIV